MKTMFEVPERCDHKAEDLELEHISIAGVFRATTDDICQITAEFKCKKCNSDITKSSIIDAFGHIKEVIS